MRTFGLYASLALVGAAGFLAGTSYSQDPGGEKQDRPAMDLAAMAEMMALGQPGPEHEMVLGGRRLDNESTGDMMGTYFVTARGKKGGDGVIRRHGVDDDPLGERVYTFELEFPSDDEQVTRHLFSQLGGETYEPPFEMMELVAKRRG